MAARTRVRQDRQGHKDRKVRKAFQDLKARRVQPVLLDRKA
jgi:hypothetical protein